MISLQPVKKVGLYTATAIVISNMIGTGVFTSLGFQLLGIKSAFALLTLWLIGGLVALTGALTYGELVSAIPRSGGEYHFLSKLYHPMAGFLAGWISLLVGFSAPVALASMALASYFNVIFMFDHAKWIAISVIILITTIHSFNLKIGGRFQLFVTLIKIILIAAFIFSGFFIPDPQPILYFPRKLDWLQILNPGYAVSLIYVSYAFSGWNAAAYITEEVQDPKKNVPRALTIGTLVVILLYFFLNFIFLYTSSFSELTGKVEVGFISAVNIFGESGGKIMSGIIVLLLISTISAMVWIGPRVVQVIGEDHSIFKFLSRKNKYQVPVIAIWFQTIITITLVFTSTFEKVLVYSGFILNIFTLMSVTGIFILRKKIKDSEGLVKTFGYPVTPVIFILLSSWTLFYIIKERTYESFLGFLTLVVGVIIYLLSKYYEKENRLRQENS